MDQKLQDLGEENILSSTGKQQDNRGGQDFVCGRGSMGKKKMGLIHARKDQERSRMKIAWN